MTDNELRSAVAILRAEALRFGSQHAAWDLIFDAEAILAGKTSMLSRAEIERAIRGISVDSSNAKR